MSLCDHVSSYKGLVSASRILNTCDMHEVQFCDIVYSMRDLFLLDHRSPFFHAEAGMNDYLLVNENEDLFPWRVLQKTNTR